MSATARFSELRAAGFSDPCALTADGHELRDPHVIDALTDEWVHYPARKPR